MNKHNARLATLMVAAGLASAVCAQPTMIITGINSDMAATGNGVSGLASIGLTGANSSFSTVPLIWSRGAGYTQIPGAAWRGTDGVYCSDDLSAIAMCTDNIADWGSLNCFQGYNPDGTPKPLLNPPCPPAWITHRWTQATGWVNTGSLPRYPDPVTGRFIGGTQCDRNINSPKGMSGDGRFVLINGWSARATTASGTPASGFCGDFLPFLYDSLDGSIDPLPVQPGTRTSRADVINTDGTVITGYDLDSAQSLRRLSVWRNGQQTLLDTSLGAKDNAAVNGPGDAVATGASPGFVSANFPGESGVRLVRWIWSGSAWVPENLGRPIDYIDPIIGSPLPFGNLWATGISDDGNTIVGNALYGPPPPVIGGLVRPFLWRANLNGGVPIDLQNYIQSIQNPSSPIITPGLTIESARVLSGDGNAILVTLRDARNTCQFPSQSHLTFNAGILYLDGSGIACDPPKIGVGPENWHETGGLSYGVSLNVVASGSWPLTYQWQREDPNSPGVWINLAESCANFDPFIEWDYEGVNKNQLRIGIGSNWAMRAGKYRVVISNSCGSIASDPAEVTFATGACCLPGGWCVQEFFYRCQSQQGEYQGESTSCTHYCGFGCYANCDESTSSPVLNVADFGCFLNKFAAGSTYANCDGSTASPVLNVADFGCFLSKFAAGCP